MSTRSPAKPPDDARRRGKGADEDSARLETAAGEDSARREDLRGLALRVRADLRRRAGLAVRAIWPDAPRISHERRHQVRRRRALAALGLVLLAVSIAVEVAGSGGGRDRPGTAGVPRAHGLQAMNALAQRRAAERDRAIDRVLAYTPFVTSGGGRKREIALTFDDGPGPYTPRVLHVLRRMNVNATFFEVGFMERWFHASTTRAILDGHVIGDHTEHHARLGTLTRPSQRRQIVDQADWLGKLGAPRPRLFRPPFGSFDDRTFRVLRNNRMLMVLWSVDSQDYRQPGPKAIVRRVLAGAHPGAIVLMHDAGGARSQTVAALPEIVRKLRHRGYRLVTVPQLMLDDPPPRGQRLPRYLNGG
jgi:peptidoglycan-N-acetylglucosamine deacetylase